VAVGGSVACVGVSDGLQASPAWLTVKVSPATVMVPERGLLLGFGSAEYDIEPFSPDPVAPPVTAIHEALLLAVHVQSLAACDTTTAPVPPAAATACEVGDNEGAQGMPACVTVWGMPATVNAAIAAGCWRLPPPCS